MSDISAQRSLLTIRVFEDESGYHAEFEAPSEDYTFRRIHVRGDTAVKAVVECVDTIENAAFRAPGTRGRYPRRYWVARGLTIKSRKRES